MSSASPTPRAQPFYCPYCGEEDFVPAETTGAYECNSCGRHYSVKFLGIAASAVAKEND
jgi:transposase-like protein